MDLSVGQRSGAIVLLIAALAAYGASLVSQPGPARPGEYAWGIQGARSSAIQIAIGSPLDGVYFVDSQADLLALLDRLGLSQRLPAPLPEQSQLVKRAYRLILDHGIAQLKPMPAASSLALGMPIDLNSASQEELALVSGIGERTAAAIVDYRRMRGAFRSLEELKHVRGISDARLKALGNHLRIHGQDR